MSPLFFALAGLLTITLAPAAIQAEPPCGGALDGDSGTFQYCDDVDDFVERTCIWIIRLHSMNNLSVTADTVLQDTSISVFTTEAASSAFPVIPPSHVFNQSTVGTTYRSGYTTVILVLNPTSAERNFTISWRGEVPGNGFPPIESANYIDSDQGTVVQDDFGLAVLALVLNPPQGDKVDVEVKVLGHEEGCANLAYSVFELSPEGALREVARTCGRPIHLANLRTPLVAFVAKPTLGQSEQISFSWNTINVEPETEATCGGSLQSNQGLLEYEDIGNPTHACAWTLRLQSKVGFRLTLLELNRGSGLGVFSSQQSASPFPVIEPTHPLTIEDVGLPLDADGEILILILNPSTTVRRFRLVWDGLQNSPFGGVESTSYLDANEGSLVQDDANVQLLAYILNPPLAHPLQVEVKVLEYEEGCANLAYSVFEVMNSGNMREIARTCGRPVNLTNVHPPLIAFVAKATPQQSETVSLVWSSARRPIDDGSTTTPDPTLVISEECGGVLVGSRGVIRYKINTPYQRNERCVWTIRAERFNQVRLQLTDDGLYSVPGFDFLTINTVGNMDTAQALTTEQIIQGGFRSPVTARGPLVFVTFRTAQGGPRGFELTFDGIGSTVPDRAFNHHHFNTSLDGNYTFRYPEQQGSYDHLEWTTLVFNQGLINLQYQLAVELNIVDIENVGGCSYDVLSINEVNALANAAHRERICPQSSPVIRTYTQDIDGSGFIFLFKTDDSVARSGFSGSYSYLRVQV